MPQMGPLMWFILFMFFNCMLLFMMYSFFFNSFKFLMMKKKNNFKKEYKFKWINL